MAVKSETLSDFFSPFGFISPMKLDGYVLVRCVFSLTGGA